MLERYLQQFEPESVNFTQLDGVIRKSMTASHLSPIQVSYTIKKEDSRSDQHSQHQSGQPKKLSPEQEHDLIQKTQEDKHIKMQELHEAVQQHASKSTV